MAKNDIPPNVRRFILTSIPSVPHLEALILLRSTAPSRWSASALAQRLYVPPAVALDVMAYLCHAGMLEHDDASLSYAFGTKTVELEAIVDAVALQYSKNLVDMTLLIHSRLDRKAQQFADAFNFKKDA
jgi:DNA-binding IclR family transcriptional regulator